MPFYRDRHRRQGVRPQPSSYPGGNRSCLPPDAHTPLVHYPEALCQWLLSQESEDASEHRQDREFVLFRRAEDDKPGVFPRGMGANVTKSHIKRDERAVLSLEDLSQLGVRRTSKPFLVHSDSIVTGCLQLRCDLDRQILINLEAQEKCAQAESSRQAEHPFADQFGGVCQRRANGLEGKTGVACQKFLGRNTRSEVIEDDRNRDARAGDAGNAMHDVRVNRDVVAPLHGQIGEWSDRSIHLKLPWANSQLDRHSGASAVYQVDTGWHHRSAASVIRTVLDLAEG